jgi:hypothetical protein
MNKRRRIKEEMNKRRIKEEKNKRRRIKEEVIPYEQNQKYNFSCMLVKVAIF